MDFVEPLDALVPGATGKVLSVVLRAPAPLSGRAISRQAGVSAAQGNRVLAELARTGLVRAQHVPPAFLYEVVDDHVAVEPLRALLAPASRVVAALGAFVAGLHPSPVAVAAFGSFARAEARGDSDLDLLVVRPSGVPEGDDAWDDAVGALYDHARRVSGNAVDVLEVGRDELPALLASDRPLWQAIAHEAVPVHGPPPLALA